MIVCIAKHEKQYIQEFVKYHLNLGFDKIYLYDNEDVSTYSELFEGLKEQVIVTHLPGRSYAIVPQFEAIQQFVWKFMDSPEITHVAHIDIDEFIVLKKHRNIKDFIKDYISDGENNIMCGGIGMNWRYFGSSNNNTDSSVPLTERFTKCQERGNMHIKTIFNKTVYGCHNNPHNICVLDGRYPIKATNGVVIDGPFNENIDLSVIQLNHYKCKTWEEFIYVRSRGRADRYDNPNFDEGYDKLLEEFNSVDYNEVEDLTACNLYKEIVERENRSKMKIKIKIE